MSAYWEKRFLQDKAAAVNASETYLLREQKKYFTTASKEITKEIEKIYQSFADSEKITLAEARARIGNADFGKADFEKMAADQVKRNRELQRKKDSLPGEVVALMERQNQAYERQLAELTRKGQITRLSMLQVNIDKALLDLYDKNQISIYDYLAGQYESAYYKAMYNCQQALGFGKDFTALNRRAIDTAILGRYQKSNYSKRLYAHCQNFSKDLKDNLITGLIRGENLDKMAARIGARLNVAASAARRLVRTESAYIYEKAAGKAYRECGIEQYEYLATLDHKTSPACQELDGKVFYVKDAVPGKNYPPMHPNCRSTTICHFDDDKVTVRTAEGSAGKTYDVPSDMTYAQWKQAYLDIGVMDVPCVSGVPKHDSPKMHEKIDMSDKHVVLSKLKAYEDLIADRKIENAIVITTDGSVIQCFGQLSGVYPDADLGKRLSGAYVTHNHPEGSGHEYSFSKQDINLFMENDLKVLRGMDDKYIYELTRNPEELDKHVGLLELDEYSARHDEVITTAERLGIGYRRYRRE